MTTSKTTPEIRDRPVADFMAADVRAIGTDDTIAEAIETLADGQVHGLPVLETNSGRFVGVLSTTDVLNALSETGHGPERDALIENTMVKDLMTPGPATIAVTGTIGEAAQQMLYLDVHRLFVMDGDDLVGVISQSDIVRALGTGRA